MATYVKKIDGTEILAKRAEQTLGGVDIDDKLDHCISRTDTTQVGSSTVPVYVNADGQVVQGTKSVFLGVNGLYKVSTAASSTDALAGGPIYGISIRENGNRSHSGFIFLKGGDYGSYDSVKSTVKWVGYGTNTGVPDQIQLYTVTHNPGTYQDNDSLDLYVRTIGNTTATISILHDVNATLVATTVSELPSNSVLMAQQCIPYLDKNAGSFLSIGSSGTPIFIDSAGQIRQSLKYGYLDISSTECIHVDFKSSLQIDWSSFKFRTSYDTTIVEACITCVGNSSVVWALDKVKAYIKCMDGTNIEEHDGTIDDIKVTYSGRDLYIYWRNTTDSKRVLWNIASNCTELEVSKTTLTDTIKGYTAASTNFVQQMSNRAMGPNNFYANNSTTIWNICNATDYDIPLSKLKIGIPYLILISTTMETRVKNDIGENIALHVGTMSSNGQRFRTITNNGTYTLHSASSDIGNCDHNRIGIIVRESVKAFQIFQTNAGESM